MDLSIISFFSQSLSTVILNLIMFLFFRRTYGFKYKNLILYISTFIIACILMIAINQLDIAILNILYGFISFSLICILLFDTTFKKSLLYNLLLIFFLLFSDIITVFIWTFIQGETLNQVLSDNLLMMISNALNIFIMLFIYKLFVTFTSKKKIRSIQIQEAVFLFLITSFEIYIIYIFTQKANNSGDGIMISIIIIGFVFLNIYATYIIDRVSSAYRLEFELSMIRRQNELQLANYTEMNKEYEKSRKVIHDIKKHLSVLNDLHEARDKKAGEYNNMIKKEVESLFNGFQCSNRIMSVVFSQKISLAESYYIKVDTKVEDISFDFMSDIDITALFANLWDNAIEACKNIEEKDRYILFEIGKVNGFVLINVKNSFNGKIKKSNGEIISSKRNHTGVGLSIIKSTVEKYRGLFLSSTSGNMFKIEITLPL